MKKLQTIAIAATIIILGIIVYNQQQQIKALNTKVDNIHKEYIVTEDNTVVTKEFYE